MTITRTFDLLDRYASNFNRKNIINTKVNGKWEGYSTLEYIKLSHEFSYGLLNLKFKKDDKIVTISNNRPEWNFVDMGMAMLGIVHVPVFTSLTILEYKHIINHSEAKMIIVSDKSLYGKIKDACNDQKEKPIIYSFDKIEGVKNWHEIVETGSIFRDKYIALLENIKSSINECDFATLIYTSGTTGHPKGVMLSHQNLVQNFMAAAKIFQLKPSDRYLSILPLCHVGGRMGNYQTQYSGASIYYSENMGAIALNMQEIKPQGFDAVPRILEKIFDSVIAKGKKLTGIKKALFFWAVNVGLRYKLPNESSWIYKKQHAWADKLIFSKWREALGGNIELCGCGGASLQPRLERVFWACGIKILNMYGLTETSPIITINRRDLPYIKLGSVGALIDSVEVKIADDGEILCKGHNVMLGYYKEPELTAQVFDDEGWFHTGDIGQMVNGKFLEITDRKKEIFKLSSGKFVAPQIIEGKLKESILIEQCMVIGEQEKHASALIVPNFSYLTNWCKENGWSTIEKNEMILHEKIYNMFYNDINKTNKELNLHERISRFQLVPHIWGPDSGELSPTLKLRRKFILEKYEKEINKIYVRQNVL